jgi:hypothetical protein
MPNVVLFLLRKVQFRHAASPVKLYPPLAAFVANQGDDYKKSGPVEYLEIYVTAACRGLTFVPAGSKGV